MKRKLPGVVLVSIAGAALANLPGSAPPLRFTSPSNGETVSGTVQITVDAEGVNAGGIEFHVDGTSVAIDRSAPYGYSWQTLDVPNGPHEITASAANVEGPAMASVQATVTNEVILAVGDSVNAQAFSGGAITDMPPGFRQASIGGAQARDMQVPVTMAVEFGQLEALIVMLGLNDASDGGWTQEDVDRFRTMINTPDPSICVAIVLPAHAEGAADHFPVLVRDLPDARASLRALAAERPDTFVLDSWQKAIDAEPGVIGPDGVHLSQDPDGAYSYHARRTRQEALRQALSVCPG